MSSPEFAGDGRQPEANTPFCGFRREENLRSMAQRIAQQVRTSGRAVTLEAMPPNERRIVHMALADFEDISTESEGEGDQRRVVVSLKHGARH